jgi:hypothetical protein
MVCSRCGSANAASAGTCHTCGYQLSPAVGGAPPASQWGAGSTPASRTGLGVRPGRVDTSWLPKTEARPGLSRAATSLASHRPASIWQAQTHDAPGARQGPLPCSQGVAAALIPAVLLCAIYGTYQAVWRRGIFAAIADDPIGVSVGGAHRSDTLNLVLLAFTTLAVVVAVGVGSWWVRKNRLTQAFRPAALWMAIGTLLCLLAAMFCQSELAVVISYAYVAGAAGTFAIGGGLAFLLTRAIQSVTGDLRWLPHRPSQLPTRPRSGTGISADGLATLTTRPAAGKIDTSGLVPVRQQPRKADWSSLKSR